LEQVSLEKTEVRFAQAAMESGGCIGAGGGVAVLGSARLTARNCYLHHLRRGLLLEGEAEGTVSDSIFADLGAGAFQVARGHSGSLHLQDNVVRGVLWVDDQRPGSLYEDGNALCEEE
jgi:hypothetical protein